MALDPLFGWNLTFKTVERDITRKSDIIIAFIHWNLTKRGFRNVGIGDERSITGNEEKSELLPASWNDKETYVLRYLLDDKLYILHGLLTDGNLIVNLMRSEDLAVSNIALKIEASVKELNGGIDKMMPDFKEIMFNIKRDLIDSITERATSSAETQTTGSNPATRRPSDDPLRMPPRPMPNIRPDLHDAWDMPPFRVPDVGRADLDPLGQGGGGMLFNPYLPRRNPENPGIGIPGGLPRGSVPPGARFDPVGPPMGPMPGRRPLPPDADHLPPPGSHDNMFM